MAPPGGRFFARQAALYYKFRRWQLSGLGQRLATVVADKGARGRFMAG